MRANADILKCCRPKGIPIIVIHSSNPKNRCVRQIQKPPKKIQITFMTKHRQPPEFPLSVTWLPKGQRASIPNFNVCNPKGMPIIVTISSKLDIRYSTAVINPPQISQMIFPKNFIVLIYYKLFIIFMLSNSANTLCFTIAKLSRRLGLTGKEGGASICKGLIGCPFL